MRKKLVGALAALAVTAAGVVGIVAAPAGAGATTTFVGSLGSCTTTTGALVAVDFGHWNGPAVRGCDPSPTTGITLLTTAGFTTAGDQHDGPQFLCRIGHPLFDNGTQYPTPAQDPCVVTPPASAYWSFWLAPAGQNTWSYSQYGAYSDHPQPGEVEAWTFGGTDIAGTNGQPAFTPNEARAGLPAGPATVQRHAQRRAAPALGNASTPDLVPGADYLASRFTDGTHYAQFGPGSEDMGLTIDGEFALAAAGGHDQLLKGVLGYIAEHQNDYTFLSGPYAQYAAGGYAGKVALAAEVAGADPRNFGGVDLITALDHLVCASSTEDNCTAAGNFKGTSSTFSLALPIIAMLRAGDGANATKPVAYLESLQHDTGAFPSVIPGEDSETDSTGMAAMALALVPTQQAQDAVAKALVWLASQQEDTGGFPGASGDSVNSAAIVIQALRLDAQTYADQIAKAEKFLASEQNADGGFNIAVGTEDRGSDLRASTQAVGGAVGIPFGSVLDDLTAKDDASSGANYLVSKLTSGNHYEAEGFADDGQTSDAVFALLGAGGHDTTVAAMSTYLQGEVSAYGDPAGAQGGPFSGGLAKLALVAEATGKDPHSFGGTDLLKTITDEVCAAAVAGDDSPCTAPGDVYNAFSTVSQALAVLALQASPVAADHLTTTSPIVQRLHQMQCSDGGFSSTLLTAGQKCVSEVDTTGYAVQALAAVGGTDSWIGAAQHYLENVQTANGLYSGAAGANSNSTALAAGALQSLVAALTSPTADPPEPKTIAPIAAWQQSLAGLKSLAVTGGGFGIKDTSAADLRASTQSVLAASQHSLLQLSGATVLSLPRSGDFAPTPLPPAASSTAPRSTPPSSSPVPTSGAPTTTAPAAPAPSAAGGPANGAGSNDLAYTGTTAGAQVRWALLLLLAGALILLLARRRPGAVRRRARHR